MSQCSWEMSIPKVVMARTATAEVIWSRQGPIASRVRPELVVVQAGRGDAEDLGHRPSAGPVLDVHQRRGGGEPVADHRLDRPPGGDGGDLADRHQVVDDGGDAQPPAEREDDREGAEHLDLALRRFGVGQLWPCGPVRYHRAAAGRDRCDAGFAACRRARRWRGRPGLLEEGPGPGTPPSGSVKRLWPDEAAPAAPAAPLPGRPHARSAAPASPWSCPAQPPSAPAPPPTPTTPS